MVVVFVAFVGGYLGQVLGPDQLLAGGVLAALLVCWFTFLPSFLFVLGIAAVAGVLVFWRGWTALQTLLLCGAAGLLLGWAGWLP